MFMLCSMIHTPPPAAGSAEPLDDDDDLAAEADALAREHLALLRGLREMSMDLARAVHRQVLAESEPAPADDSAAEPAPPPLRGDLGLIFSRLARTVRLTVTLEGRVMRARLEGAAQIRAEIQAALQVAPPPPEPVSPDNDRLAQQFHDKLRHAYTRGTAIERAVVDALESEDLDEETLEERMETARAAIFDRNSLYPRLCRPISQGIADICADLGITPDWDRWINRTWAIREVAEGEWGSVYSGLGPPGEARRGAATEPP
jgi:hypothetical protein